MNTAKEILLKLIEDIPENQIPEVIDFVEYLKMKNEKEMIIEILQRASTWECRCLFVIGNKQYISLILNLITDIVYIRTYKYISFIKFFREVHTVGVDKLPRM